MVELLQDPAAEKVANRITEEQARQAEEKKLNDICATCTFQITIYAGFEPPDTLVGHSWIQVDDVDPSTCRKKGVIVRGFWPKDPFNFTDLKQGVFGVPGIVNNDADKIGPGSDHPVQAHKTFTISCSQAVRAKKEIEKWEKAPGTYHGYARMCATFALTVLRAAGQDLPNASSEVPDPEGTIAKETIGLAIPIYSGVETPVGIYHAITGKKITDVIK
ncbi:hypothetical protein [Phyllobacterium myrsinacearum]|uniref:Uncharacterized protein n=1 Tax=Phyllobacterium myrsinacearum TaxID=28101 RepID=A0A839EJ46_9HYPH|nr:hypothetical protein [Phyllobacterium myrsinacearum]MBA8878275.1 hypothetical protein [Phyllobacterium myrsinacearum]